MTLADYIIQLNEGSTRLHEAASNGTLNRVSKEIEASGEKLHLKHFLIEANGGWTPLHYAAMNGHLDQVVEALQASGEKLTHAHLLVQDVRGWTPLQWATRMGHLDQVKEVLGVSGENLSADYFLVEAYLDEQTALRTAEMHHLLNQVFAPSLWQGQVREMMRLWEHVSEENREEIDFKQVLRDTIQLSVDSAPKIKAENFSNAVRAAGQLSTPDELLEKDSLSRVA